MAGVDSIAHALVMADNHMMSHDLGSAQGENIGLRADLDATEASNAGLIALRNALAKALAEVAPNHPLANKDERNKIYNAGREAALS